jgi:phage terminase large subunit-like protein
VSLVDDLTALIADGPARPAGPRTVGEHLAAALDPPPPRPWRRTARPEQLQVADSRSPFTFYLAGRGAGKTHTGSNTIVEWALTEPGFYAVVAPTFGDCQTICVEGKSGILVAMGTPSGAPNDILERYDRSKYRLYLRNGSVIVMASDEAPARLRGPNYSGSWLDEPGSWKRVKETYEEGVLMSTRIGSARKLVTGTPKRGNKIVKELHDKGVKGDPDVLLVRGRTLDNAANLSPEFLRTIMSRFKGTTMGQQELEGILLRDADGALMTTELIDATRCTIDDVPDLRRVLVAVDPAVTSRPESDHTGIVVVGIGGPPLSGYLGEPAAVVGSHLYVLADESMQGTPRAWAERVLKTAEYWAADGIVMEVNQGGDLVSTMVQMVAEADGFPLPHLINVRAAVKKRTRAEPVAGVFEQRRIHVVGGLSGLEDELAGWSPGDDDSPDRLDGFVWGAVGLMPELAVGRSTRVALLN